MAVGSHNHGPFTEPDGTLAEKWNGRAWRIKPTPKPAEFAAGLFNAVSCSSARFCMAVGYAYSRPDTYRTLAEAWSGSTWTIEPTPTPGAGGHLDSVSCTSATSCIAGGLTSEGQLAEHWDGSTWTVMSQTELPTADLRGVSCTEADSCTAVGLDPDTGSALAEHWNGSIWTAEETTDPGHGRYGLNAVSCPQASSCVAVGSYTGKGGAQYAFSATWNGATWTDEKAPSRPGTNGDYLTGITCFSAQKCIAAGFTQTISDHATTLVAHWNGSSWKTVPSPKVPAHAAYFEITSSSCAAKTACAAVGEYIAPKGGGTPPQGLRTVFIMQTRSGG